MPEEAPKDSVEVRGQQYYKKAAKNVLEQLSKRARGDAELPRQAAERLDEIIALVRKDEVGEELPPKVAIPVEKVEEAPDEVEVFYTKKGFENALYSVLAKVRVDAQVSERAKSKIEDIITQIKSEKEIEELKPIEVLERKARAFVEKQTEMEEILGVSQKVRLVKKDIKWDYHYMKYILEANYEVNVKYNVDVEIDARTGELVYAFNPKSYEHSEGIAVTDKEARRIAEAVAGEIPEDAREAKVMFLKHDEMPSKDIAEVWWDHFSGGMHVDTDYICVEINPKTKKVISFAKKWTVPE